MESLDSLRECLNAESIEHDSTMDLKHLQMLVSRRVKRRARERGEKPKWAKLDFLDKMKTLRGVRRAMAKLADDDKSTDDKLYAKASFIIDTLPDAEIIKCEHHADWRQCRGNVEQGRCRQCQTLTPGVLNYSFQVLIRDEEERNTMCVNIGDGTSLFGMTAVAFNAMAPAARADAKARVVGVPVFGRMICAYDRADDYFNTTVYDCTVLAQDKEGSVA